MKNLSFVFILTLTYYSLTAQGFDCHTHSMTQAVLDANPNRKAIVEAAELMHQSLSNTALNKGNSNNSVPLTIPVVFHVMHQYGVENISKAQIEDAIQILNEDFNKLNADTSTVHPNFKPIIGNTQFIFKLATIDENNNCTDGIVRHFSANTNTGSTPATQAGITWNPSKYLNIFTVKTMANGSAGYTYLPGTWSFGSDNDAIIILHDYVGSIGTGTPGKSRALTHEVGHWFGLNHVWGNTNQPGISCGDDGVSDTPESKGWSFCNVNGKSCPSDPAPVDNVENYMEYAYCQKMFTNNQSTRMRNTVLVNIGNVGRGNLFSAANIAATGVNSTTSLCKPKADMTNIPIFHCSNAPLTLFDLSWKGAGSNYLWKLIGPVTYTSTNQNPVFTPTVVGVYDIRLIVTNAAGIDSITRPSALTVKPGTAFYTFNSFSENFPSTFTFSNGWETIDPDFDNGFINYTGAGVGDNTCLVLENQYSSGGETVDMLETPGIDFTNIPPSAKFFFHWAYAKTYTIMVNDRLNVDFSINCGKFWNTRLTRSTNTFKSTNTLYPNRNFIPSASQWRKDSIIIGSFGGPNASNNLKIRFRFTNDVNNTSNPFYIDKIGIQINSGIEDIIKAIDLSVYPNPSKGKVNLKFNALNSGKLNLKVESILGHIVFEKQYAVNFGTQSIDLSQNYLFSKGAYILKFEFNDIKITKKLLIE